MTFTDISVLFSSKSERNRPCGSLREKKQTETLRLQDIQVTFADVISLVRTLRRPLSGG